MLYLVATPIGNLSDISKRAIDILSSCDYIAAEDTRHTLKLLNALGIKKKLVSYHAHNEIESAHRIVQDITAGMTVCLVSDAGCPGISDPGNRLVKLMYEHDQKVSVIPGPNAAISALMMTPFDTSSFCFEGFPPTKENLKKEFFERLQYETRTAVIYEAPHKLESTLKTARGILGDNRSIALVKEITKIYESVTVGDIPEIQGHIENNPPKGEYVIVIEGHKGQTETDVDLFMDENQRNRNIKEEYEKLVEQGLSKKDAVRKTAVKFNMSRNEIYSILIDIS